MAPLAYHTEAPVDQPLRAGSDPEPTQGQRLSRRQRRDLLHGGQRWTQAELQHLMELGWTGWSLQLSLNVLRQLCEEEADHWCGARKGQHAPERQAYRHGTVRSFLTIWGMRVEFERPRVRAKRGGEIQLEAYRLAQEAGRLEETLLAACLAGVSQRTYAREGPRLHGLPEMEVRPLGHSALSQRFIELSQQAMEAFLQRPLQERYLVLFLDGVRMGESVLIQALAVADTGELRVLGLWQGDTENATVCERLLDDLERRGFQVHGRLLAVIDGSKALESALRKRYASRVLIQRCQVHKARNVEEKLPKHRWPSIRQHLYAAWRQPDPVKAQNQLQALATRLRQEGFPEAAASLEEGLEATLTCRRLGLPPELERSLRSTNLVESTFSRLRELTRHVKHYQSGEQTQRWAAVALAQIERRLQRLDPALMGALAEALERA